MPAHAPTESILESVGKGAAILAEKGGKINPLREWLQRRRPTRQQRRNTYYVANVGASGFSAGYKGSGFRKHRKPPPKTECTGWSYSSTNSMRSFFHSVDPEKLWGKGFAVTLTVGKIIPPSAAEFHESLKSLIQRFRYAKGIRWQWHIEWQRRGAPHIHGMVWFPKNSKITPADIVKMWLKTAEKWGAKVDGQHVKPVTRIQGWLEYQSIHAFRGVAHYQRARESMPTGWIRSGRMWGRGGNWDLTTERKELTCEEFHKFRRFFCCWLIAKIRAQNDFDARSKGLPRGVWTRKGRRAIKYARMLYRVGKFKSGIPITAQTGASATRGLAAFLPSRIANALLAAAGYPEIPDFLPCATHNIGIAAPSHSIRFPPSAISPSAQSSAPRLTRNRDISQVSFSRFWKKAA